MEIEKDYTIPFLDTSVLRDSNGLLTTSVCRKPTHTDQYLALMIHTILSQWNVVWLSVYTTKPNTSQQNHQLSLKKRNIYHRYLFQTDILLHFYESSQRQQNCLQQQGVHVHTIFKSDTTLRSHLAWPKDTLEPTKQDGVVCKIPCECGKVYMGETGRAIQERIKAHDRDIRLARTQTSAVLEHANEMVHVYL